MGRQGNPTQFDSTMVAHICKYEMPDPSSCRHEHEKEQQTTEEADRDLNSIMSL